MFNGLNFVQQPTPDSCTSACLAMITGMDIDSVIAEYHEAHHSQESNASLFLSGKGIVHELGTILNNTLKSGYIHLLAVPSLNLEARMHNIVYSIWPDGNGMYYHELHDPNFGKEGKRYYVTQFSEDEELGRLAVPLGGMTIDLKIKID